MIELKNRYFLDFKFYLINKQIACIFLIIIRMSKKIAFLHALIL